MDQILPGGGSITLIHLVYALSDESPPDYRIACMPNMLEFHATPYHPAFHRSNDARAVTCPACKRTEIYKKATEVKVTQSKPTGGK